MRWLLLFLLAAQTAGAQQRPNIIYIMSDDHDDDAISAYNRRFISTPSIDRLAKEGMLFTQAFVGNSICSPARATLLTGQHSHKNGVKDNFTRFDSSRTTIAHLLHEAGYQTAIIGKWHLHSYPAGFDFWKILPGQGLYYSPRMITMQGDTITEAGYATETLTRDAIDWLDHRDPSKPFVLLFHHKAPHRQFVPALKWLEKFHTRRFPEPATLYLDTAGRGAAWRTQTMSIRSVMRLSADLKVDPAYLNDLPELKPTEDDIATYQSVMRRLPEDQRKRFLEIYAERGQLIRDRQLTGDSLLKYKYQWYMQDYLACVASVDESVGQVLDYLDRHHLARNTVVIYTSDQGFYLGENGWFDKRFAYDVSMKTPLLIRWPGKIKAGAVTSQLVQNIDYAPTFLDLAGARTPDWMQGLSLRPLLLGQKNLLPRQSLYYHYYEFSRDHTVLPHLAVRNKRYKLIYFYTVDEWECYDLWKDPGEIHNRIHDPGFQPVIQQLKAELSRMRNQYDDHEPAGSLQ